MRAVTLRYARQNLKRLIKEIQSNKEEVAVPLDGGQVVMIMDFDEWKALRAKAGLKA